MFWVLVLTLLALYARSSGFCSGPLCLTGARALTCLERTTGLLAVFPSLCLSFSSLFSLSLSLFLSLKFQFSSSLALFYCFSL